MCVHTHFYESELTDLKIEVTIRTLLLTDTSPTNKELFFHEYAAQSSSINEPI